MLVKPASQPVFVQEETPDVSPGMNRSIRTRFEISGT